MVTIILEFEQKIYSMPLKKIGTVSRPLFQPENQTLNSSAHTHRAMRSHVLENVL